VGRILDDLGIESAAHGHHSGPAQIEALELGQRPDVGQTKAGSQDLPPDGSVGSDPHPVPVFVSNGSSVAKLTKRDSISAGVAYSHAVDRNRRTLTSRDTTRWYKPFFRSMP
jgi:hypothetical protein